MSGLPAFLTDDGGVNSGLMIPQVTAAALVSENKSLAFPASVDSIPTSAGQEDHVSMAPIAARKAAHIARNAAGIIAVELIAAAQGVDYHAPLKTCAALQAVPRQGARHCPRTSKPTAIGRTRWRRSRRRCSPAKSASRTGSRPSSALACEQVEQHSPAAVHAFEQFDRALAHPLEVAVLEVEPACRRRSARTATSTLGQQSGSKSNSRLSCQASSSRRGGS